MPASEPRLSRAIELWQPIARLYAVSTLDSIIEIAIGLASDVTSNPSRYKSVPDDVSRILDAFRTKVSTDAEWPNAAQRTQLYAPLLGSSFEGACGVIRSAAVTLAEQPEESSNETLRSAFLDAVATSSAYLKTLDSQGLAVALSKTQAMFVNAIHVLQTPTVGGAFGVAPAPNGWPFDGPADGGAAVLVEVLTEALGWQLRPLNRHRFLLLQRSAFHGANTLTKLFRAQADSPEGIDDLMNAGYLWEKALQNLLFAVDMRQALVNPAYRASLSQPEQSLLPPHPSGTVGVQGTEINPNLSIRPPVGFSTLTVRAICCSTGDLPCSASRIIAFGPFTLAANR
ncbi:MAG TPA: hypothetical protein VMF91_11710 [Bryobacteraceae bacterium]|nr:hypothetical protein [Bryobacteraceae bacterium]